MSTSSALLRVVTRAARDAGAPVDDRVAHAGIGPQDLARPDGRIPTPVYLEIFAEAARASGRDDFGVTCASRLDAEAFGLIGFVLGSAPTLGDAFERLARFSRLLSDELSIVVTTSSRQVTIRYAMEGTPYVPALFEMAFVHCIETARRGAGEAFRAEEVTFAHPVKPALLASALHGARVTKGRHNEVRCPRAMADLPLLGANRTLLGILEHQASVVLERLPASDDFLAGARAAILRELVLGEPTLAVVADRLRIGARTFQRRLAAHGITYQTLLDHVRRDEALARLQTPDVSVAAVALALGYRDASAFHHAFRRWTGQSPRQARARTPRGG